MVWDFFGIFLLSTIVITGWNLGLRNSWPVPIGMWVATVLTQLVYVPVCSWATEQLQMPVGLAVFVGYLLLWLGIEVACEGTLLSFRSLHRQYQQSRLEKTVGACLALAKGIVVVMFASLAALCNQTIIGPHTYSVVGNWLTDDSRQSTLMNVALAAATALPSTLAAYVVSSDAPTISVELHHNTTEHVADSERARQVRDLFKMIRELQAEAER